MSRAFLRYLELMDELLWKRAISGGLTDEDEERFATALNDCRTGMTSEEQGRIEVVVAARLNTAAVKNLGLVDAEPSKTDAAPLRKTG